MRTATVVAREKTVLGVLDYEDYQAILGISLMFENPV